MQIESRPRIAPPPVTAILQKSFLRRNGWRKDLGSVLNKLPLLFCYLFGALSLVVIVGPGDGTWQLYANAMLNGRKVYSDLGLNQQPLFPLITETSIAILPNGIIAQRAFAFVALAAFVLLIYKVGKVGSRRWFELVAIQIGVFFTIIHFEAYRFEDYHIVAEVGVLASLYLSSEYLTRTWSTSGFAALQGVITAFVLLTRLNEGLALIGSLVFVILEKEGVSRHLARAAAIGLVSAIPCILTTIWLVDETPSSWVTNTVIVASQAKGGSSMFYYPWVLLRGAAEFIGAPLAPKYLKGYLLWMLPLAAWLYAAHLIRRRNPLWADVLLILCCGYFVLFLRAIYNPDVVRAITPFVAVFTAGASLYSFGYLVLRSRISDRQKLDRFSLLFYPFFLFIFGSLSSGGDYTLYFPTATALLVIPQILSNKIRIIDRNDVVRLGFYLLCAILGISGLTYRWNNPYSWHSYHVSPYFRDYVFVRDERLGPHFMTKDLVGLIRPVCSQVHQQNSLLSIPFSFANYYCGIPPWKGYVQTFFDLSTSGKIDRLIADLETAPPRYIFYQRQLESMRLHELTFNRGLPLPHRKLDRLIMEKLARSEWHVVYQSDWRSKYESELFMPSSWLLIRTDSGFPPNVDR